MQSRIILAGIMVVLFSMISSCSANNTVNDMSPDRAETTVKSAPNPFFAAKRGGTPRKVSYDRVKEVVEGLSGEVKFGAPERPTGGSFSEQAWEVEVSRSLLPGGQPLSYKITVLAENPDLEGGTVVASEIAALGDRLLAGNIENLLGTRWREENDDEIQEERDELEDDEILNMLKEAYELPEDELDELYEEGEYLDLFIEVDDDPFEDYEESRGIREIPKEDPVKEVK